MEQNPTPPATAPVRHIHIDPAYRAEPRWWEHALWREGLYAAVTVGVVIVWLYLGADITYVVARALVTAPPQSLLELLSLGGMLIIVSRYLRAFMARRDRARAADHLPAFDARSADGMSTPSSLPPHQRPGQASTPPS